MTTKDICRFKTYLKCKDDKQLSKTRKKINRKRKDGSSKNVYGWSGYTPPPNLSGAAITGNDGAGDGAGMGESYNFENPIIHIKVPGIFTDLPYKGDDDEVWDEENHLNNEDDWEDEEDISSEENQEFIGPYATSFTKKDQARMLYHNLRNQGGSRKYIISQFQRQIGLSRLSAIAYYERIAREYGQTRPLTHRPYYPYRSGGPPGGARSPYAVGVRPPPIPTISQQAPTSSGEQKKPEIKSWHHPDRQGTIRRVKNAHLVYKRQTDDGSFEELWVYKEGKRYDKTLNIRRDILAGTDIPVEKTKSADGSQRAEVWSSGDTQFLHIQGLPN
jgi:hypothetical protein